MGADDMDVKPIKFCVMLLEEEGNDHDDDSHNSILLRRGGRSLASFFVKCADNPPRETLEGFCFWGA